MIMDYEAEIEQIEQEIKTVEAREKALRSQRHALYLKQREELEKEVGEINAGDIVVVKQTYGDAKDGMLMRVYSVHRSEDRGGDNYTAVSLDFFTGGMVIIPITCVVRVPDEQAALLWKQALEAEQALTALVREKLDRYSYLRD